MPPVKIIGTLERGATDLPGGMVKLIGDACYSPRTLGEEEAEKKQQKCTLQNDQL